MFYRSIFPIRKIELKIHLKIIIFKLDANLIHILSEYGNEVLREYKLLNLLQANVIDWKNRIENEFKTYIFQIKYKLDIHTFSVWK